MTDDKIPMHITHSRFPWAGVGQLRPREATDEPLGRAVKIVLGWASYGDVTLGDVVAASHAEAHRADIRERLEVAGRFFAYLTRSGLVEMWTVEDGQYAPVQDDPATIWSRYEKARLASHPQKDVTADWSCLLTLADHIQAAYDSGMWQSEPGWIPDVDEE